MFLKRLLIQGRQGIIRDIPFRKGLNLIVDEGNQQERQKTGNNVGKTTVLRLIDYCLGAKGESIYKDTEFAHKPNTIVQNFLTEQEVKINLELVDDLENENSRKITIERNFLKYSKKIIRINGENIQSQYFNAELKKSIFNTNVPKPTFRQIIAKNIRIDKDRMNNIVKVLGGFGKVVEYEALYFFWLGISTDAAEEKRSLKEEETQEKRYQKRLLRQGQPSTIDQELGVIERKIEDLNEKKENFNINKNYEKDIQELNQVKKQLNQLLSEITQAEIRKELIEESQKQLESEKAEINTAQIKSLYSRAKAFMPNIQVTFEDTLKFHNELIKEKLIYITKGLPKLRQKIYILQNEITALRRKERELTQKLQKRKVLEDLETIVSELNKQHERKGELEKMKNLWQVSNDKIREIQTKLNLINKQTTPQEKELDNRIHTFNEFFPNLSNELYKEEYILSYSKDEKQNTYALEVSNIGGNTGTGKKKGQIAAFDFAYIRFANKLGIPCLHFIMHDQLETVHENQLTTLIEVANGINGQYIVPILRGKIPSNIDITPYEILTLSQEDKLFKLS